MSDLAEFLLAQIAEDQALAEAVGPSPVVQANDLAARDFLQVWHPDRVLAECEAKRRIVGECKYGVERQTGAWHFAQRQLRLLALPYADHPDYREEWRP